ncbi:MAG: hypothetical protein HC783_14015, partial [Rhodobacteraceae bacterium]|nr:hypothetical protein [Paracoccaceae bacterium]
RIERYAISHMHMPEIIAMCERLIAQGFAYAAAGNVWFDVSKDADYGKLSNRKVEQQEAGLAAHDEPDAHQAPADELVRRDRLQKHGQDRDVEEIDERRDHVPDEVLVELEVRVALVRLHADAYADRNQKRDRATQRRSREDLRRDETQSGTGAAPNSSCDLRSRSRQTSSPA